MKRRSWWLLTVALAGLFACQGPSSGDPQTGALPDSSTSDPSNPPVSKGPGQSAQADVLLYNGSGVSTSDWQSTESIIAAQGWSYRLVNSTQLNAMSLDELAGYGVIVVPGGTGSTITSAITPEARLNVRKAVRDRGVGYVGFCAGAWIAVGPEAAGDAAASYGLAVAPGSVLAAYFPDNTSATAVVTPVTLADGSSRELVWWGGPSTPEWSSGVVGRYKTGDPAISEIRSGNGLVVISGPHPEAPEGWRATAGYDSDGLDTELAVAMIRAAMTGQALPAY